MSIVPAFVYGTLRPGDYNHDRFPGGVVKVLRNCKTKGKLYHAFAGQGRIYPGARFDEDGIILGDILFYDGDSEAFRRVVNMEIGAGYSIAEIKVETESGDVVPCVGFNYDRPHGALIESGDWFAEDAYEVDPVRYIYEEDDDEGKWGWEWEWEYDDEV